MELLKLKSRGCNVYLLEIGGKRILIDTGTPLSAKLIESQLESIDAIVITHAHFDHIGSASYLQKKFGCEIFIHRDDMPYLLGERKFSYSGILGKLAEAVEIIFRVRYPDEARPIDELSISGVEIIHTPGHTPGSICIKVGENLFCGDLFRGKSGKPVLSPKTFCSDYSAYINSIRLVSNLDFSYALPGHGETIPKKEIDELVSLAVDQR